MPHATCHSRRCRLLTMPLRQHAAPVCAAFTPCRYARHFLALVEICYILKMLPLAADAADAAALASAVLFCHCCH